MRTPVVRRISAEETIALRLAILRHGLPRDTAIFPGDDADTTRHFGAFDGDRLVGVASIYHASFPDRADCANAWQLRGMATEESVRGRGFGSALLAATLAEAASAQGTLVWCNARTGAIGFYEKHGFRRSGDEFDIPTAGPHVRMWIELKASMR